ncbi:MAG TPA: GNAT family N-acetyltransferase [Microthrixaceae bacterium]|nr:GNAT family N-acetyltransferase [Microthrixaceae bacterium]HMY85779.1 GNAT family N-acetyltransferase [Microthrixaceae bacterium]HNE35719.1 GNAT family N-acetyltransferase [Microthrixaceae bacterium]HNH94563.1 GNAT family N-acetyltransferase [Microthrixaceae bacterium]HNJ21717.1 GNAT family N-acetyltransferase [Microthrixaceae bacterium]
MQDMTSRQLLRVGEDRFRVGPWHADDRIAYLALPPPPTGPSVDGLNECLRGIAAAGYSSVITSALHPTEARPFLEAGFTEYDRLRVLSHDLRGLDRLRSRTGGVRLRRARRSDRDDALAVDNRAFPVFWRLDRAAMTEAEKATPVCRFRVALPERDAPRRVLGYAVTGRGSGQGFLQRLAVDPDQSGHGIGSALVLDALCWASRRRCRRVLVNTQRHNTRALALYRRLGFEVTPTDLLVLHRPVP